MRRFNFKKLPKSVLLLGLTLILISSMGIRLAWGRESFREAVGKVGRQMQQLVQKLPLTKRNKDIKKNKDILLEPSIETTDSAEPSVSSAPPVPSSIPTSIPSPSENTTNSNIEKQRSWPIPPVGKVEVIGNYLSAYCDVEYADEIRKGDEQKKEILISTMECRYNTVLEGDDPKGPCYTDEQYAFLMKQQQLEIDHCIDKNFYDKYGPNPVK